MTVIFVPGYVAHAASPPPPPPPPGPPVWLPQAPSGDYATDAALFQTSHYYSGGGVVADPATIFGAVSGFTFDQSQISASGMLVNDANTNRPLSIGTFNTSLCSSLEQTLVFEVDLTEYPGTSGDGVVVIGFGDNSTTDPLQVDWYPDSGTPTNANWEATNADWGSFDVVANGPGLAVWKMAITTKANGDVVSSFNGNPIHTDVASEPNAGTPNVFIFGSNDTLDGSKPLCGYFRRIVRFAPQPDADLPTLSTP